MKQIIREARPSDMAEIMKVMDAAKRIMRQSGNMHQWTDGYPSEAVITADMEKDGGNEWYSGSDINRSIMRLPYATMFCLAMVLVACGQQPDKE